MSLISHIESSLGEMDYGWGFKECINGIQVARFKNQPFIGSTTYVSLGLSEFVLPMSGGRTVSQELLFSAYDCFSSEQIASFMLTFCDYVIERKQALLRGDVVGPASTLIPGATVNSIYASIPSVFKGELGTYYHSSPATVIVWLIPLLSAEAAFIKSNGWSRFEDILEANNPDLWDLKRSSIV